MTKPPYKIAIIGGGPAGLIAAETLAKAGLAVTVYERKPSPGRKFLMAGRGGLNLTHSEPIEDFLRRYGPATDHLRPAIESFTPTDLQAWCEGLGQAVFTGTSGRIFPKTLKASPLLRAWMARLEELGVVFAYGHEWTGWGPDGAAIFKLADGAEILVKSDATVLALGGGSWAKLGSDGGWVDILRAAGIPVSPLRASNCGFTSPWSDHFRTRFAGQPVKTITVTHNGTTVPGEIMITENGVEGGAIYALSASIREALPTPITVDLKPGLNIAALHKKLLAPRGAQSFSTYLQKSVGLTPVAINLLRECAGDMSSATPEKLARAIKAVPVNVHAAFPIDRAISTAGGIEWAGIDADFMLRAKPGVFVAGEMIDWEAPTGGYLLQASFSTGIAAAQGVLKFLVR